MGKLDRIRNRVETLLLHWLGSWHCTCQHRILPNITVGRAQSMSLYGHRWFKSLRRRFPPFLSRYAIYLWVGGKGGVLPHALTHSASGWKQSGRRRSSYLIAYSAPIGYLQYVVAVGGGGGEECDDLLLPAGHHQPRGPGRQAHTQGNPHLAIVNIEWPFNEYCS